MLWHSGQCSEGALAQRAVGLLARVEPLVQAGRVELVVARAALELGQRARGGVDDRVADRALLDALEDLGEGLGLGLGLGLGIGIGIGLGLGLGLG